ncbi:BA14K family protein [Bradyrhizobium cytisi]|uniref:Lectin-like protein BA14k n=2 Tax=Nitrobacteraceae TaxID=41294 RepID=A0A5S4XGV9_9BRAD|nr:BA14K family protein [Bradyrhizobium cytisi]
MPSGRPNVQFAPCGPAPRQGDAKGTPSAAPRPERRRKASTVRSCRVQRPRGNLALHAHTGVNPGTTAVSVGLIPGKRSLTMNSLRVLSAAAALALVLPMATPSFAQGPGGRGGGGGGHFGGGGGAHIGGGGGGAHFGGGGFSGGARMGGGGGNFAAGAAARPSAGPAAGPAFNGGGRNFAAAGGHWNGGGGNWHGGGWHRRGGGFWPGVAAGAAIGAIGSSYAYYGGGPYYGDSYYDDSYYDDGASVAVVPDTGGDSSGYCAQRYRSYDPASGTYLGYDGLRHPCP